MPEQQRPQINQRVYWIKESDPDQTIRSGILVQVSQIAPNKYMALIKTEFGRVYMDYYDLKTSPEELENNNKN